MNTKKACGCGQKTKNPSGICDQCLDKIRLLNRIREIIGKLPSEKDLKEKKRKRRNPKYETYFVFKPLNHVNEKNQLCWYCEKACGKCSWSKDFTPVEGWDAEPATIRSREADAKIIETFYIKSCPEYEPLKMRRQVNF